MLFNSHIFIFLFLPLTVVLFHLYRSKGYLRWAIFILVMASLTYYGWWMPVYLFLLIPLILSDYFIARYLIRVRFCRPMLAKTLLLLGITINLGTLCYFKYATFIVDNLNDVFGLALQLRAIVLPIGISFFTFQKTAFLVDAYQNKVQNFNFFNYILFVCFFPQLIAGPIIHHAEMMPQFKGNRKVTEYNFALGITFFVIGLAKKVLIADTAALYASPEFQLAAIGTQLDMVTAWKAVLAYTVQIYFDFSAYSDMAIGIGQFFGINLPINFNSPYKSTSIIDFWQRWHITLSRFLRDYLYIPLGGNRKGETRRYVNLFLTMLLGGIWHGAGWTFVIWGTLHGLYLIINHVWKEIMGHLSFVSFRKSQPAKAASRLLTFLAVATGWVFFRSPNIATAFDILKSLFGFNGIRINHALLHEFLLILCFLFITFFLPNTQQVTSYEGPESNYTTYKPRIRSFWLHWEPNLLWSIYIGFLFVFCIIKLSQVSEFIYFQF